MARYRTSPPAALGRGQAGLDQRLQVLDDGLAGDGEVHGQAAGRVRPVLDEPLQETPPGRVGQRVEEGVDGVDQTLASAQTESQSESTRRSHDVAEAVAVSAEAAAVSVMTRRLPRSAGSTANTTVEVACSSSSGHQRKVRCSPSTTSSIGEVTHGPVVVGQAAPATRPQVELDVATEPRRDLVRLGDQSPELVHGAVELEGRGG